MQQLLRVIFENISGGFVLAGDKHGEMVFSRVSLREYIEYFKEYHPDILALSEVHMEDDNVYEKNTYQSEMVQTISEELELPNYVSFPQSRSHLDTSKFAGLAVLSRFPIVNYQTFLLPNPRLEIDKPDGSHWVMFDKGAQKITLDIMGTLVVVVNLHYFPFHHFGHRMNEAAFADIRRALVDTIMPKDDTPTIITGDFNNKGLSLREAFPELFAYNRFREAVHAETTVVGLRDQFDHILYTPGSLDIHHKHSRAERNYSDHFALIAEFNLVPSPTSLIVRKGKQLSSFLL